MKLLKHALLGLTCMTSAITIAAPVELDRVAVIVNDGVILQSDINSAVKTLRSNAKNKGQSLPDAKVLRKQVVDKLILDTIQLQEAERLGVRIDDNRLDQAIQGIAKDNNKTLDELQLTLAPDGIDYATFREQIRKEIAISEARNALVRRRINILPAEVETLTKQLSDNSNTSVEYKIQHIQLKLDDSENSAAVEKEAEQIIEKLNQGEDFSKMAITYSKGPKALEGGNWGWMRKEEMPTIFADQITTQTKGAVIGPFRSGVGFHILKIDNVKGLETVAVTEINSRHILIKPSVILSDDGAKQQLIEITERIKNGEASFAQLATQYSQDPGSAAQNGELGYQTADIYVPEFKHQIETLTVGEISEPFKTVHGWHIVEVLDKREVDKTDTAQKNKAYRILFNRKFNEEASAWIQEMKAGAFIEYIQDENGEN
ncbi:peptidylprolyl isomerase SurA [Vibrio sp. SCSIO 43137]|uniref:peptidylprolyl isomerase SurA n=1 Tax=Vibrio sp. SCSIO 43137 TaxID=3021011 RepID=UPI002306E24D|nr:peptidylprolyl isomerase SurA [Vibrio sp. SCSIO 43137]WCE29399.1 peptidylprolyl isomerase SurA [Vibrio sp. SCSIO 43137]